MKKELGVTTATSNSPVSASRGKKVYERPRILTREALEAVAATCTPAPPAKAAPGFTGCNAGILAS